MTVLLAGLCTVDTVQRVATLPAPGQKVQSLDVDVTAGGPAANAAVTVAALGGDAWLWTVLGAHPLAQLARGDLEACGVRLLDLMPEHAQAPAVSAAAVRDSDGERTVVSYNGANAPPVSEQLAAALRSRVGHLREVRAVLLDGHHPEVALGVAQWARARGVPVVLDAGSWKPVLETLLPLVDVCACSANFRVPEGTASVCARDVPTVLVSDGARPVRWSTASGAGEVAVPAVRARDTLGAGDVWHGALAYGLGGPGSPRCRAELTELTGLTELIAFANEVAAERVRHVGPRAWVEPVAVRWRGQEGT